MCSQEAKIFAGICVLWTYKVINGKSVSLKTVNTKGFIIVFLYLIMTLN